MIEPLPRFVVFGLGGAGTALVSAVKKNLEAQLRNLGWNKPLPSAWQFAQVDLRDLSTSGCEWTELFPHTNTFRIVPHGFSLYNLKGALQAKFSEKVFLQELQHLCPETEPPLVRSDPSYYRSYVRASFLLFVRQIEEFVKHVYAVANSEKAREELEELLQFLGLDSSSQDDENLARVNTITISSLVGSTGSAFLIDLEALVSSLVGTSDFYSFLLDASCYEQFKTHPTMPIRQMTALNEILERDLVKGEKEIPFDLVYKEAGLERRPTNCQRVFVRRNSGSFDLCDLYWEKGKAIADFLLSGEIAQKESFFSEASGSVSRESVHYICKGWLLLTLAGRRQVDHSRSEIAIEIKIQGDYTRRWIKLVLPRVGNSIISSILYYLPESTFYADSNELIDAQLFYRKLEECGRSSVEEIRELIEIGVEHRSGSSNRLERSISPSDRRENFIDLLSEVGKNLEKESHLPDPRVGDDFGRTRSELRRVLLKCIEELASEVV